MKTGQFFCPVFCFGKNCYNRKKADWIPPDGGRIFLFCHGWGKAVFMKRFFWIFLMAGTVFLIWHNSMQDQVHSERASFFFVTLVQPWLAEIGRSVPAALLDHIVRKTAHVFEYTVLGLVLYSGLGALMEHNRKVFWAASASGLLTAAIDENIQMFSPGRGPQLSDVGIDFCGVLLGCFLGYLWKRYRS